MRRNRNVNKSVLLFPILLLLLSASASTAHSLRGMTVAMIGPTWSLFQATQSLLANTFTSGTSKSNLKLQEHCDQLELENHLLQSKIAFLEEIIAHKKEAVEPLYSPGTHSPIVQHHLEDLEQIHFLQKQAIPAHVIYRSPLTWNHTLWIQVGEKDNPSGESPIIQVNSPVVIGTHVVGVIDYVGSRKSRVRLITDPSLTPAVQATRGRTESEACTEALHNLIKILEKRQNDPIITEETLFALRQLEEMLNEDFELSYLAKGELQGTTTPQYRSTSPILKGTGFNYDFADRHGPARDLYTGKISQNSEAVPLIQTDDILLTTGMDGIFPAGLKVAKVIEVHPLKEGDYYYEILAKPLADLHREISLVFVLPPIAEHPFPEGWTP